MKDKEFATTKMTPGEFFDRFTIILQKSNFSEEYKKRIDDFIKILEGNNINGRLLEIVCQLQIVNINIWHLESQLRKGEEGELGLREVGKRAIQIRNYNRERTKLSNALNILFGETEQEKKFDHCSKGESQC